MIWKQAIQKLQKGLSVYLLWVISSSGSSPGRPGFRMLVAEDGSLHGSIGGGLMEYHLTEEARHLLQQNKYSIFVKKQVHRKNESHSSGMICSGEQIVAFLPLNPKHIKLLQSIEQAERQRAGQLLRITPKGLYLLPPTKQAKSFYLSPSNWQYEKQLLPDKEIYIFGAGHVGQATATLFHWLGFHIHLMDERPKLVQQLKNKWGEQISLIKYCDIRKELPIKTKLHIAIMTTRYTDDLKIVKQLCNHPAQYIGLLGSKAKIAQMFRQLKKEGFPETYLQRLYAPIGLPIGSQTPEEIALSIAAQIFSLHSTFPYQG